MDEGTRLPPTNRMGRRMNSQMNISLPVEMHERLRTIAWEERIPLSHLCRHLIDLGIKQFEEGAKTVEAPAGSD